MPKEKSLTERQLTKKLKDHFGHCPHCGSGELSASSGDGGMVYSMPIKCEDCGAEWYEHYKFVSASDFEPGEEADGGDQA